MIVFKDDKGFQIRSDKPNENWTNEDVYVVEDGTELADKIIVNYPYFDFVLEDGELIDITPTERPEPEPEEPSEAELIKRRLAATEQALMQIMMEGMM